MSCLSDNLKVLLWKSRKPYKSWPDHISGAARACGIPSDRFIRILNGEDTAAGHEMTEIKKYFSGYCKDIGRINETLLFPDLFARYENELMAENLRYLLSILEYGEAETFITAIEINMSTLTRWKSGKTTPCRYFRARIAEYFGFKNEDELKDRLLFMDRKPATVELMKRSCRQKIDAMGREQFEDVYPEILKLLTKDI